MKKTKLIWLIKGILNQPLILFCRGIGWSKSRFLNKNHLCIACFPKSGSTYLAKTLEAVLDYNFVNYANLLDDEHNIVEPLLIQNLHVNTVSHLHLTGTISNLFYLHYYKIKHIVQIRNIFDCVVSLRDHIVQESPIWPMAVIEHNFTSWDFEKQYDFIIDNFVPWYIKFYVSWFLVSQKPSSSIFWVQYEDLMSDKYNNIAKILYNFRIPFNSEKLRLVLDEQKLNLKKGDHRLNVGKVGRGQESLSLAQIDKIKSFTRYYPTVDFKKIGL